MQTAIIAQNKTTGNWKVLECVEGFDDEIYTRMHKRCLAYVVLDEYELVMHKVVVFRTGDEVEEGDSVYVGISPILETRWPTRKDL